MVLDAARVIWNVFEPLLASRFAVPAKVYAAVAVPAFTLSVYVGAGAMLRPSPVTPAVHGVCAPVVYVTDAGQLTAVVVAALAMVMLVVAVLPVYKLPPANVAVAVHVLPAPVQSPE